MKIDTTAKIAAYDKPPTDQALLAKENLGSDLLINLTESAQESKIIEPGVLPVGSASQAVPGGDAGTDCEAVKLQQIRELHSQIIGATKICIEKATWIGQLVRSFRLKCKHGEWLPWVRDNLPFSAKTAERYIDIYENAAYLRPKLDSVSNLTEAYKLLAQKRRELSKRQRHQVEATQPSEANPNNNNQREIESGEANKQEFQRSAPASTIEHTVPAPATEAAVELGCASQESLAGGHFPDPEDGATAPIDPVQAGSCSQYPHYSIQSSIYSLLKSALHLSEAGETAEGSEVRRQQIELLLKKYEGTCEVVKHGVLSCRTPD